MRAHLLASLCAILVAGGCRAPGPAARAAGGGAATSPPRPSVRLVQSLPDEAYWVSHDDTVDRVVSSGSRLETSADGEVRAVAWEADFASPRPDPLLGGLAVAPHLGGGYLVWSSTRLYRTREFTGPLEPIELPPALGGETYFRGARNGLASVFLITDAGPLELAPGSTRAVPATAPGVFDTAAVDARRAARIDVFGRTAGTVDGGATWIDGTTVVGLAARALSAFPDELLVDATRGRYALQANGAFGELESFVRTTFDYGKAFQTNFRGARSAEREGWGWYFREQGPLQQVLASGARLPDGTAIGTMQSIVVRVDLASGKAVDLATSWFSPQLSCNAFSVPDGLLFLCTWDRYDGYGAVALRSVAGEPPVLEQAFTADGFFVGSDDGAVAFVGSCERKPRVPSVDEGRSYPEVKPSDRACVRRGPGDWVEHRIASDAQNLAWVPRLDGTAVALVFAPSPAQAEPLPLPLSAPPPVDVRPGVRVVRVFQEFPGYFWARGVGQQNVGRGLPLGKAFRAHADGTVDAWLQATRNGGGMGEILAGVTIAPDGRTTLHEPPPETVAMIATGDFGVALDRVGTLHETVDHGRTWTSRGPSPVPYTSFQGACSSLGCSLGSLARVGWGDGGPTPRIATVLPPKPVARPVLPALACVPSGAATPIVGGPPRSSGGGDDGARMEIAAGYGADPVLVREVSAELLAELNPDPQATGGVVSLSPQGAILSGLGPPVAPVPTAAPSASAAVGKPKPKRGGAALRTHSLYLRPPFDLEGRVVKLNATNLPAMANYRRPTATPLLGAGDDVGFLVEGESSEAFFSAKDVEVWPYFELNRYGGYGETATATGVHREGRGVLVSDARRRFGLEDHGPLPQSPLVAFGLDRDALRQRALVVGEAPGGELAVVVLEGSAAVGASVAVFDRRSNTLGPVRKLAPWSTLTPGADPACRGAREAIRVLVPLDGAEAFATGPLGGVAYSGGGLAKLAWTEARVCLEGLSLVASTDLRTGDGRPGRLVYRAQENPATVNGALEWASLRQPLVCTLTPPRPTVADAAPPRPSGGPR